MTFDADYSVFCHGTEGHETQKEGPNFENYKTNAYLQAIKQLGCPVCRSKNALD